MEKPDHGKIIMEVEMLLKARVFIVSLLLVALMACGSESTEPAKSSSSTSSSETTAVSAAQPACDAELAVELANDGPYAITAPERFQGDCEMTLAIKNYDVLVHNFRILKTSLALDALTIEESTAMVDIEAAGEILYSSGDLEQEATETGTVSLDSGEYVLFCNIAGHYQLGMVKSFTVN